MYWTSSPDCGYRVRGWVSRIAWLGVLAGVMTCGAETVRLRPVADTTLFESSPGDNMGGWTHMVAGTTGNMGDRTRNRALLKFDLAGVLPAGAEVVEASLRLAVTRVPGTAGGGSAVNSTFAIHRVLQAWGEGDKLGDRGAPADPGEATWNQRVFGDLAWAEPGAGADLDRAPAASGAVAVAGLGTYEIGGAPGLLADVRHWVEQPADNHGWLLVSQSEERAKTARAFGSREEAGHAPELVVTYEVRELRIDGVTRRGEGIEFEFVARADRAHAVEWTSTFPAAGWSILTNVPPAAERRVSVSDLIGVGPRWYRVRQD